LKKNNLPNHGYVLDASAFELFSKKFSSLLIPNGVDTDKFKSRQISRKSLDLPEDKFIIFSASAFDPIKRLDFLIKAASKINNSYLLFCGSGKQKKDLRIMCRNLMGDNMKFLGMINKESLVKYYNVSDVFCLPSQIEPFGIVLVESMACQIPVVTNNSETQKWIVNNGGSCVDVADMNVLVKALEKYKDKDLANKIGKAGRKNVLERFTWDKVADDYYQLFRKLIK